MEEYHDQRTLAFTKVIYRDSLNYNLEIAITTQHDIPALELYHVQIQQYF